MGSEIQEMMAVRAVSDQSMEQIARAAVSTDEFKFTLIPKEALPANAPGKYDELARQLVQNLNQAAVIPVTSAKQANRMRGTLATSLLRPLPHPEQYRMRSKITETILYVWLEHLEEETEEEAELAPLPLPAVALPNGEASAEHKLDWNKYPTRKAFGDLGPCAFCKRTIRIGDAYYDGGYAGRRAHCDCVSNYAR